MERPQDRDAVRTLGLVGDAVITVMFFGMTVLLWILLP